MRAEVLAKRELRPEDQRAQGIGYHLGVMSILYFVYAALLLVGGILGYARAKSAPSLVAGAVAAVLTVIAALLLPHHPRAGLGLGILVSLGLGAFFFQRYQETKKPMPALLVLVMSVVILLASLLRFAGVIKI